MLFTTLVVAAIIVAGLYFLVIRFIPSPKVGYAIMVAVGIVCLLPGDVHFRYIGIEIAALGSLVMWLHHQYVRKPAAQNSSGSDKESDS